MSVFKANPTPMTREEWEKIARDAFAKAKSPWFVSRGKLDENIVSFRNTCLNEPWKPTPMTENEARARL